MSDSTLLLNETAFCPAYAPLLGALGAVFAVGLTCLGAAYGTAKCGVGVTSIGVMRPELVMKSVLPVVMAGIIGLYGVIIALIMHTSFVQRDYSLFTGSLQLGAGLCVGLAGLAAGFAVGVVGESGVRGYAQQPRLFIGMILILIFAEVLGLYGLVTGILLNSKAINNIKC